MQCKKQKVFKEEEKRADKNESNQRMNERERKRHTALRRLIMTLDNSDIIFPQLHTSAVY